MDNKLDYYAPTRIFPQKGEGVRVAGIQGEIDSKKSQPRESDRASRLLQGWEN